MFPGKTAVAHNLKVKQATYDNVTAWVMKHVEPYNYSWDPCYWRSKWLGDHGVYTDDELLLMQDASVHFPPRQLAKRALAAGSALGLHGARVFLKELWDKDGGPLEWANVTHAAVPKECSICSAQPEAQCDPKQFLRKWQTVARETIANNSLTIKMQQLASYRRYKKKVHGMKYA